jgi:drug/metabolite transporter (DMT)-like permease
MTASMAGYVINDALIKKAAEGVPLFQAIAIRGLFVVALLATIAIGKGATRDLGRFLTRPLLVRISMESIGTVLYLSALTRSPLAGLTAVLQIVPLAVTFVAARLLRERVRRYRIVSLAIGFIGVLIIIRPSSDDFNPWFLVGLLVVITIVIRELATTRIPANTPSVIVSLSTAVAITTIGFLGSVVDGWGSVSAPDLSLLAGAAAFLSLGYLASVITVRTGELSFSAPFRYTVMIFAIVLQIIVFGEVPDALTFLGTALIAGAGLYVFRRETLPVLVPRRPRLRF